IVFHQAALGSVPRSIENPITSNEVNVSGFLNMLVASRDNKVKRLVYAASSSTYGDSIKLPKIEEEIGKPLSPYAVTKYVNELYAHVFGINYGLEIIGLRYFNVFGRRQDPNGSYAAVIPKFLNLLMKEQSPIVNGDGSFSRDFTYIDNVILMNHLAAITTNKEAIGQVFNTAVGERNTLKDLIEILKKELSNYNPTISKVEAIYGVERSGDIPHSLASIDKAVKILGYLPSHHFEAGIKETIKWYWNNLNN
ncbi:MAG: NAD-dependent epimerase/dehydratase family protein, partial [Flavobacterium sp.]